jgi:hypothetical protein
MEAQKEASLYDRLGGKPAITAVVTTSSATWRRMCISSFFANTSLPVSNRSL